MSLKRSILGIVLENNPIALADKDRSYHGIFDLCIESISDSSKEEVECDTKVKKEEYAQAGVSEYFMLNENGRETAFCRLNQRGVYVPIQPDQGVIRSTALKGFQFRVADLYRQPTPPEMLYDAVYQSYASPFVGEERPLCEQEERRAEQAEQRADMETARANRYAEKLRALGIEIEDDLLS